MNIENGHRQAGNAQLVLFPVHRHIALADLRQLIMHLRQGGNGIAGQRLNNILMRIPVAFNIIRVAKRHINFTHCRAVQRHMLANIGPRAQHAGGRFQLINQDSVVIFTAGKIHRLAGGQIKRLKVRCRNVDDI